MRTVTTSVLAALGWLALQTGTWAQSQPDFANIFGAIIRQGISQALQSRWKELPQGELACIEKQLRIEGTSISQAIQRGIGPSDPRLSASIAICRSREQMVRAAVGGNAATNVSIYAVEGLAVGGHVVFNSPAYAEYACTPSEQFVGHSWCRKKRNDTSPRGSYVSTYSILHANDGTVSYVNRSLDPAWFSGNEADEDIARLARKFDAQPKLIPTPRKPGVPAGIIASWGNVRLDPVDQSSMDQMAAGQSVRLGIMIDHLGDFQRSAKAGLPIYRLGGGAGYVWAANWDEKGRGTLRFLAIDASAMSAPSSVRDSSSQQSSVSTVWPPVPSIPPAQPSAFDNRSPSSVSGLPPVLAPQNEVAHTPASSRYRMESGRAVVSVTGYGATPSEARNDAVRQAVQKTMQQLIVVDRVIKNDEIVRDKIMSTMNGYVEGFKELSLRQDGQQTIVEAEVTVSPTKIENFIGQSSGSSATIDGGTLQQESERELSQRKVRGELFDRLFKGFPSEVLKPRLTRIVPSERDPSRFVVTIEISYSPAWISALRTGMKGIAIPDPVQAYPDDEIPGESYYPPRRGDRVYRRGQNMRQEVGIPRKDGVGEFCLDSHPDECFRMPAGNYGGLFKHSVNLPGLYVAIKFVDVLGKSVHLGDQKCIIVGLDKLQVNLSSADTRARSPWFIDTRPLSYTFPLPPASMNVGEAKKVVLLTAFGLDRARNMNFERRLGLDEARRMPVPTSFGAVTDILDEGVDSDVCNAKMDGIGEQAIGAEVLGGK